MSAPTPSHLCKHRRPSRTRPVNQFFRAFCSRRSMWRRAKCSRCCGTACGFSRWQQVSGQWFIKARCTRVHRPNVSCSTRRPKNILWWKAIRSSVSSCRSRHAKTFSVIANIWFASRTTRKSRTPTPSMLWSSCERIWRRQSINQTSSKSTTFTSSRRCCFATSETTRSVKASTTKTSTRHATNDPVCLTNSSNYCPNKNASHGRTCATSSTFKLSLSKLSLSFFLIKFYKKFFLKKLFFHLKNSSIFQLRSNFHNWMNQITRDRTIFSSEFQFSGTARLKRIFPFKLLMEKITPKAIRKKMSKMQQKLRRMLCSVFRLVGNIFLCDDLLLRASNRIEIQIKKNLSSEIL